MILCCMAAIILPQIKLEFLSVLAELFKEILGFIQDLYLIHILDSFLRKYFFSF